MKLKLFIPPVLLILYRKFKKPQYGWSGNYLTWQEAVSKTSGYDSSAILEKCKSSLLQVKNGQAVYERDSVLFDKIEYSWPLLSAMLLVAAKNEGKLNLIDFGGSLGSTYFQNRFFLNELKEIKYNIVEQKKFVDAGKEFFETDVVKFYESIDSCLVNQNKVDLIILSSVIQYLENPEALIDKIVLYNIPYVVFDLTPFMINKNTRLTIQNVPSEIYTASYPSWILNYDDVIQRFQQHYNVISEHENTLSFNLDGEELKYRGFFLKHKNIQ